MGKTTTSVATFGCSWTYGVWPENNNWSKEFALQNPEVIVNDYSLGGTSLKWSTTQLLAHIDSTDTTYKVFQITAPGRYTYEHQDVSKAGMRTQETSNFQKYNNKMNKNVVPFNTNFRPIDNINYTQNQIDNAWELQYDALHPPMEYQEFCMYIDWLRPHVDFCFFHNRKQQQKYYTMRGTWLPCVEDEFGTKQFVEWSYDVGNHFTLTGSQGVAKWVKQNLDQ